ncbi:hypothetical protein CUU95_10845 [Vreelandella alkaliphila]|uniref:hypothetical protein n=1 Tax=Vreelandella alkaliphila TaxID=272774 RepID=UPI000EA13E7B|nr:hypothetical protein [Halomonas alkaliphila]AYF34272.1 hypothetical protein CUU95_10845 [Halomonas alkaliphila]
MPRYSFKIDPLPPEDGYGWILRYFEDGWEIPGYETFSAHRGISWMIQQEFENAKFTGELWVEEMAAEGPAVVRPRPEYEPDCNQINLKLE